MENGDAYMHYGPRERFYVSAGERGLFVIDSEEEKLVRTIPLNALSIPESGNNKIYVADMGKLHVIDADSLEVEKTINVDYPSDSGLGMAFNPVSAYLYVITAHNTVTVVDPSGGRIVDTLDACPSPRSVIANKKTGTVYVACPGGRAISVIK